MCVKYLDTFFSPTFSVLKRQKRTAVKPGLDYRGNKCTAVVPHGTGTTAGTYRGTVLKKVPVTVPKAQK